MRSPGATPYLYKNPLAPWARIKLCWTRTDYRVITEMSMPHHYPASWGATRPQVCTGGSPSGEGAAALSKQAGGLFVA